MKALKIILATILSLVLIIGVLNIIPPKKNIENNPFLVEEGSAPMVAAHRGGAENSPENTMLAFKTAVRETGVDIIETDLNLTKDGYLVYVHDEYIDRVCNVNGDIPYSEALKICEDEEKRHNVRDMTLEELRQYNFGYYYEDENGDRPYKDVKNLKRAGLQISTIDEVLQEFKDDKDLLFIIEIKDDGEEGKTACKIVWDTLEKYPEYKSRVVIGSEHGDVEAEIKENYPEIMRDASNPSAKEYVVTQLCGVNIFDTTSFTCLQIPTSYDVGFDLGLKNKSLIKRAHRRNIAVQYWTINDEENMRELTELGCDCIMTDNPKLLKEVLKEYN